MLYDSSIPNQLCDLEILAMYMQALNEIIN